MPVSVGISRNSRSSASKPPADAPLPTTWLGRGGPADGSESESGLQDAETENPVSDWFGSETLKITSPGR